MCNTVGTNSELWLKPCLSSVTVQELSRRRVSFADAVPGKALTAVKGFCKHEPPSFCGKAPQVSIRRLERVSRTKRSESCPEQQISEHAFTRSVTLTILTRPSGQEDAIISLGFARYDERLNAITGSLSVKNLHYEKDAFVRYTTDGWCTFQDMRASYSWSRSAGQVDIFTFVLLLPSSLMIVGTEVEFALAVNMGGTTHWDNNEGKNFKARVECAWAPPPWSHGHSRFTVHQPPMLITPLANSKHVHQAPVPVTGISLFVPVPAPATSSEEDGLWAYMNQPFSATSWSHGCLPAGNLDDQVLASQGSFDELNATPSADFEQNPERYYYASFFPAPAAGGLVNAG